MEAVIIYDGECNLCNTTVKFVKRHDKRSVFSCVSAQSDEGKALLSKNRLSMVAADTVILFHQNTIYTLSEAVLVIFRLMGGKWKILYFLKIIPASFRDYVYKVVARNRHRLTKSSMKC
ncbi:MAG: DUF393 domain-containing protein [Bacteroidales bacterium]